jgi:hypothetical protein
MCHMHLTILIVVLKSHWFQKVKEAKQFKITIQMEVATMFILIFSWSLLLLTGACSGVYLMKFGCRMIISLVHLSPNYLKHCPNYILVKHLDAVQAQ